MPKPAIWKIIKDNDEWGVLDVKNDQILVSGFPEAADAGAFISMMIDNIMNQSTQQKAMFAKLLSNVGGTKQ